MKSFEKTPESEIVIRFPDCDPFHHLEGNPTFEERATQLRTWINKH